MSSKNRVNPDHYKLAGRDPQGETIQHDRARQMRDRDRGRARGGNFIPGGDRAVGAMGAKQGMKSGSQKAETSHYGARAMPATRGAAGAFGRDGNEPAVKRKKSTKSAKSTARTKSGAKSRTNSGAKSGTKRTARAKPAGKGRRAA